MAGSTSPARRSVLVANGCARSAKPSAQASASGSATSAHAHAAGEFLQQLIAGDALRAGAQAFAGEELLPGPQEPERLTDAQVALIEAASSGDTCRLLSLSVVSGSAAMRKYEASATTGTSTSWRTRRVATRRMRYGPCPSARAEALHRPQPQCTQCEEVERIHVQAVQPRAAPGSSGPGGTAAR